MFQVTWSVRLWEYSCLHSVAEMPKRLFRIGNFSMTSRLGLVGRESTTFTPLWPRKSVVFVRAGYLPEFLILFSLLIIISEMYFQIHLKRTYFFTRQCDQNEKYWQVKKKWQVILQITSKTGITLRWYHWFYQPAGKLYFVELHFRNIQSY